MSKPIKWYDIRIINKLKLSLNSNLKVLEYNSSNITIKKSNYQYVFKVDPQFVAAHRAYLKAYKELNKAKFHESYAKYVTVNKEKIKEYQQKYQKHYYARIKEERKNKNKANIMPLKKLQPTPRIKYARLIKIILPFFTRFHVAMVSAKYKSLHL